MTRLYVWFPRLPVACAHVTPLGGVSPVGGHGDVLSGGSPWTVTGPLFDLMDGEPRGTPSTQAPILALVRLLFVSFIKTE